MKLVFKLAILVAIIAVCFVLYSQFGILYIITGVISMAVLSSRYISNDKEERMDPTFPVGRPIVTDTSATWIGAKLGEKEAWEKEAQREPRDQGH